MKIKKISPNKEQSKSPIKQEEDFWLSNLRKNSVILNNMNGSIQELDEK